MASYSAALVERPHPMQDIVGKLYAPDPIPGGIQFRLPPTWQANSATATYVNAATVGAKA